MFLDIQVFRYLLASWTIKLDGKVSSFQQKTKLTKTKPTQKQTTDIEKKKVKVAILSQTFCIFKMNIC